MPEVTRDYRFGVPPSAPSSTKFRATGYNECCLASTLDISRERSIAIMATKTEPEIILYDLGSTKNVCFSPVVWRIRMMLNYKKLPYTTIFLEFPDIEPT